MPSSPRPNEVPSGKLFDKVSMAWCLVNFVEFFAGFDSLVVEESCYLPSRFILPIRDDSIKINRIEFS
jgi:hypothetical protein